MTDQESAISIRGGNPGDPQRLNTHSTANLRGRAAAAIQGIVRPKHRRGIGPSWFTLLNHQRRHRTAGRTRIGLRVLFATGMNSKKFGSMERWILLLGDELTKRGHSLLVHYAINPSSTQYVDLLEARGITLVTQDVGTGRPNQIRNYRNLISQHRIDVVLSMFSLNSIFAATGAGVARSRNIWINPLEMPARTWRRSLLFRAIDMTATAYAASNAVRDQMIHTGFAASAVRTWYLGLPIQYMDLPTGPPQTSEKKRISCVAFASKVKGVDLLLHAFRIVLNEMPEARLIQAGIDPIADPELPALAEDLGISHAVQWCGLRDDAVSLIASADVYVQPSRQEALGFTVMEAAYTGRPIVAFAVGGIPEALIDGQTGLLAEPENTAALARNLLTLLRDPDLAAQMGVAGRALMDEKFMSARIISEILDSARAFS